MHWLIQRGFDSDRQYLKLIEQIERMGIGHTFCTVVPFSDADNGIVLESEIPEGVNIFTYGSYTLSKHSRARGYTPGAYLGIDPKVLGFTTDFDNLVHTPLAPYLLNSDLFINTFGNSNVPEWEEFFFKPNSDTKAWVAEIITRDKFVAFRDKINSIPEGEYSSVTSDTQYLASSVKVIDAEYRFFVVRGKIATYSQYKIGDRVVYDPRVDEYIIDFAKKMIGLYEPDDAYVMDICTINGECKIVEFNTINSSGLYAIDVQKLIIAVDGLDRPYIRNTILAINQ